MENKEYEKRKNMNANQIKIKFLAVAIIITVFFSSCEKEKSLAGYYREERGNGYYFGVGSECYHPSVKNGTILVSFID